jgi:HemY protein
MIKLIFFFVFLLIAVLIGLQINADPGYLYLSFHSWSVEMPLWLAIALLVFTFLVLHSLFLLVSNILAWPNILKKCLKKHHVKNASHKIEMGFIELNEGLWQVAQKHLITTLAYAPIPLINYLMAAQAAQALEQFNLRDRYLSEAERLIPHAKMAITLTKTKWLLEAHQWEQALATLTYLQNHDSKHPMVLKLLLQLYQATEDWPKVINLLPDIKKSALLTEQAFIQIKYQAYLARLNQLIKLNLISETQNFIHQLPRDLKSPPQIMLTFAGFMLENNLLDSAEKILHTISPQSSELLFYIGKLCLKQKLWGKAKQYFENSIQLHPSKEAYAALGDLLMQFNDRENATKFYQQGLWLSINKP